MTEGVFLTLPRSLLENVQKVVDTSFESSLHKIYDSSRFLRFFSVVVEVAPQDEFFRVMRHLLTTSQLIMRVLS